ncbi:threonine/serine exporter family protein [Nocardioides acrostichi]|uniref:Threonine/serine exporter family protein n=1 Tax=Nocardioides acrostichi TaxID=2784339 RepID=A0A930UW76_9ACTN|nr:threonine/serine exporter family protein [Nocardioides acrostichi]MBF4160195.1 threonine/serine exporter family protein [Nocardioides acrostichi]
MTDEREVNLTLDLCLRMGELLLSTGVGAADVTATMLSVSRSLGLRNVDVDIIFTSLTMSYQDTAERQAITARRQVQQRAIDYEQLTRADHLIRAILNGETDLRGARTELGRITSSGRRRPRTAITFGWGVMAAGVGLQLGGNGWVLLTAFVSAMLIDRLQLRMSRRRMPGFYQQVLGGGVASLLAIGVGATPLHVNVSAVITANIVLLLAGIGFMSALQDALTSFYITAGARLTEALLATAGIIAGVSGGLGVAQVAGLRIPSINPGRYSLQTFGMLVLGAAVAAAAFAYASRAPHRILAPIALVAGVAIAVSRMLDQLGVGRAWSVAWAALLVGVVAYAIAGRFSVPPLVVVVPALVPMLPGISIYTGLSLLAMDDSQVPAGLLALGTAVSVAIALAAGVLLGQYLSQPLKREARRLEARLSGPRLVGPVRQVTRRRESRRVG